MKKLVIINGVTGAIGSACLARFASSPNTVVYGLSRKAKNYSNFLVDYELPQRTLVCSIEGFASQYVDRFIYAVKRNRFSEVVYIHALGHYPFEIDEQGNHVVLKDNNMNGIDSRCTELTYETFTSFYAALAPRETSRTRLFLFGGIADKYHPIAHASWWKTIEQLKEHLNEMKNRGFGGKISLLNISSVICPNELISRPFVFSATDADPQYWLRPDEVSNFLIHCMSKKQTKHFKEYELFKKKPGFDPEYYTDEKFTPRKVKELFR